MIPSRFELLEVLRVMNDFNNAYKRLSELMALLMSERFPEGFTIKEISSSLNVPPEVVIDDILTLTSYKYIRGSFVTLDRSEEKGDPLETCGTTASAGSYDKTTEAWLHSLKTGEASAFKRKFRIEPDVFLPENAGDMVAVNLSTFEKNVFARAANVSHLSDSVWIKKPAFAGAETPPGTLGPLQMAIEQGHPVTFTYVTETGEEKEEGFVPRQIYTDLLTRKVYLAGIPGSKKCVVKTALPEPVEGSRTIPGDKNGDAGSALPELVEGSRTIPGSKDGATDIVLKRIDRIRNFKVHNDEKVPPVKPGELNVLDYIWGGDISPDEMTQKGGYVIRHVKIRISKDTGNIFEKIKTETNGRRFGKLYDDPENEGIAYYEDDVCGMGSFKRWLLGYGASVMVLEPAELAEEMYRILLNRLERYRDFTD